MADGRNPLRVGIIGADTKASWAQHSHVPSLAALPDFRLAAVATRRADSARAAAEAFGAEHWSEDPAAMIRSDAVDVVTVAVRVPAHRGLVLASEEMVGGCIAERSLRDRIVLGTKFTWNQEPGNPNAGGNGRKNVHRALDASLKRLRTDYVDLYWLHFWDGVTPVDEVLQTMGGLVRSGKVRYFALSDLPAWHATKMAALAAERGVPGPIAVQSRHSLLERTAEDEHIPAGREGGFGFMPWSPLAGGFLAGKYEKEGAAGATGEGRLAGANPFGQSKFTDRNWAVLERLKGVARDAGRPPAEVALAWASRRPGVSSVIVGASRPDQLLANLAALGTPLTAKQLAALDEASAPEPRFPYSGFGADIRRTILGGTDVTGWLE